MEMRGLFTLVEQIRGGLRAPYRADIERDVEVKAYRAFIIHIDGLID